MTIQYLNLLSSQSMAASITSAWADVSQVSLVSIQAVWTGSPNGAIKLQASNDGITADDIADTAVTITGADSVIWNVSIAAYNKIRVVYTRSSGTGSLSVNETGKGGV